MPKGNFSEPSNVDLKTAFGVADRIQMAILVCICRRLDGGKIKIRGPRVISTLSFDHMDAGGGRHVEINKVWFADEILKCINESSFSEWTEKSEEPA